MRLEVVTFALIYAVVFTESFAISPNKPSILSLKRGGTFLSSTTEKVEETKNEPEENNIQKDTPSTNIGWDTHKAIVSRFCFVEMRF
mmetsp:Transcript_38554/g.42644  ORF Transcript_38554/g.42644 Transcript_38554/m.42644 type:complete len:87 (+) Transcript_38554:203-463(+)